MSNIQRRTQGLSVSIGVIVIIFLAVTTTQLSSMIALNGISIAVPNSVYAKYSNSQAQSLVNDCGSGVSTGTNCAINGPQTQADGTASSPIVSISGGQGPPGPQGTPGPEGPKGDPGDASELELQVREVGGPVENIESGTEGNSAVSCDSDEVITGGGMAFVGGAQSQNTENYGFSQSTDNTNTMTAGFDNPGPNDVQIESFVLCAQLVDTS